MKVKSEREVAQLCPTLCDPMDCSLPGSTIHGIFQARVLEWGAIAFFPTTLLIPLPYYSWSTSTPRAWDAVPKLSSWTAEIEIALLERKRTYF